MAAVQPTLIELATKNDDAARSMSEYMELNNLAAPSFAADSAESYPQVQEVPSARMILIETLLEMLYLAISSSEYLFWHSLTVREVSDCWAGLAKE